MTLYGVESPEVLEQQRIYKRNHAINEQKVRHILDTYGWPDKHIIGERGNLTICNVIQHSANEIRIKYLPMMRNAVEAKQLHPRFWCALKIECDRKGRIADLWWTNEVLPGDKKLQCMACV